MLIAVCVIGAYIGIMVRLFYERPERFFSAVETSCTTGPFLLAIGTILWLAFRQNPLSRSARKNLAAWAVLLLLTPIAGGLALNYFFPTRDPLQYLSNYRLIHERLQGRQVNEPGIWNELTNRINKQALSKTEAEESVAELITYMKFATPGGWNKPVSWQEPFLQAATQANLISDEVLCDLCDAFYASTTTIKVYRADRRGVSLYVEHGGHWLIKDSGVDIDLIWSVTKVMVDGTEAKVAHENAFFSWEWQGDLPVKLEPGLHEVSVELECAYIDHKKKPGNLTKFSPDKWPPTLKRWTTSASTKFTVPDGKATGQQDASQSK